MLYLRAFKKTRTNQTISQQMNMKWNGGWKTTQSIEERVVLWKDKTDSTTLTKEKTENTQSYRWKGRHLNSYHWNSKDREYV
jgi:hypothetical protein